MDTYTFTVQSTDANGLTAEKQYTFELSCNICENVVITLSDIPIESLTYGVPYSETVTSSGGTGPYSYILSGSLPTGLTFSVDTISGTTTDEAQYNFNIISIDSMGCIGSRSYYFGHCPDCELGYYTLDYDWETTVDQNPDHLSPTCSLIGTASGHCTVTLIHYQTWCRLNDIPMNSCLCQFFPIPGDPLPNGCVCTDILTGGAVYPLQFQNGMYGDCTYVYGGGGLNFFDQVGSPMLWGINSDTGCPIGNYPDLETPYEFDNMNLQCRQKIRLTNIRIT